MSVKTRSQIHEGKKLKATFDKSSKEDLIPWGFKPFANISSESTLSSPRLAHSVSYNPIMEDQYKRIGEFLEQLGDKKFGQEKQEHHNS